MTDIYRVLLSDIDLKGYVMLRAPLKKSKAYQAGDCYIADKIKLTLSPKGDLVLVSTTLTVLVVESESDMDSLELSQKQHEPLVDFKNELEANQGADEKALYLAQGEAEVPTLSSTKQILGRAEAQLREWAEGQG